MLQKYAATQKMTGTEQARSGHFCLCGYGAKAPLTANAVISVAGVASKSGKQHTRVWGRPAQQAEDCEAIPKKQVAGRWSLLQSDGFRLFHGPGRHFAANHRPNWRKLFVSIYKLVRPLRSRRRSLLAQSSRPRRPRTFPPGHFLPSCLIMGGSFTVIPLRSTSPVCLFSTRTRSCSSQPFRSAASSQPNRVMM